MQKATRHNDDIHREHHQEELDTDAKAKAKEKAATEQLEKKPRKLSVFMSRASSSRVAPAEGDGGSFSRLSSSRQSTGYRGTTFWRKKKPAQETRRRSAFDRLTRRTSSATNRRRGSIVGDKIKAASDVASRRLHLMKRRMSFNAGLPGERYADTATYDPSQLLEELKLLLEHENLLLADLEQEELPEIMRRDRDFGLSHEGGSSTLDANQFELWRGRIASYVRTFVLMRELHLDQASTSVEAEGEHDLADSILQILQRCGNVKDITLHDCTLSNTTLTSICQLMRARLRSLDLHGTRGFDDVGLKALAAYCSKLQTLKLGGCAITDSSLQVVIKHCPELRLVEVSDSLRAPSLVQLPEACTVSKINTGKQSEAQNAGATTATQAETKAWNASSSIRTPQDSADGHAVPVIEEEATSPTAE